MIGFASAHPIFTVGATLSAIVVIGTFILALLPAVPIPQTEIDQLVAADEMVKDRFFQHVLHEYNVFNERLNFFLVFESVSLGVIGALYANSHSDNRPAQFLALFGLLVSLLWLYVQARQKSLLDSNRARAVAGLPDYAFMVRYRRRWPISTVWLLAYFLPFLVLLMWLALLAIFDGGLIVL